MPTRPKPPKTSRPTPQHRPPVRRPPVRQPAPRRDTRAASVPWLPVIGGVFAVLVLLGGFLVARSVWTSPGPVTPAATAVHRPTATVPPPTLAVTATSIDTPTPLTTIVAPPVTQRLAIFEAFLRPACPNCQAAAQEIETVLAGHYTGQPVVFLEYNADAGFRREERWWAASNSSSVTLPMVMSNGGYQISSGFEDFHTRYTAMVDTALARPPQAALAVTGQRERDTLSYSVQVTNLSGITLGPDNEATVWAIVYEIFDTAGEDRLTNRLVRAVVATPVTPPLASEATATTVVVTEPLTGVVWEHLHTIVLVDYRPGGTTPAFDVLQAVSVPLKP